MVAGAIKRYNEMIEKELKVEINFYRNRSQIQIHKRNKGVQNPSTWFLVGETTGVLTTLATPGAELKNAISKKIGQTYGQDGGFTKVVEDGGIPISMGLKRRDPHKADKCIYNEDCIVDDTKKDCAVMNTCYIIECNKCPDEPIVEQVKIKNNKISTKQNYIGTTGHKN